MIKMPALEALGATELKFQRAGKLGVMACDSQELTGQPACCTW